MPQVIFGEIQTGALANGGLARKAPIGPKRALSGQFLLSLVAVMCGGIGPNWPRKGPTRTLEKGPTPSYFAPVQEAFRSLQAGRMYRTPAEFIPSSDGERPQSAPKRPDFPASISPRCSLKIWGLSPRLWGPGRILQRYTKLLLKSLP